MLMMQRLRTARFLAWTLTCLVATPYLASGAFAAEKPKGDIFTQSVVLFPLDNLAGEKYAKLATEVTTQIACGIEANPRYTVIQYSDRLPAIQRLISTQPEKKVSTGGPFFSDPGAIQRALELARAMSADIAMVGSLDTCKWDPAKKQATVMGTLEWYDTRTGKKIDTLSATGIRTRPMGDETSSEDTVIMEAASELVQKMVSAVTGEEYKAVQAPPTKAATGVSKTKSKRSWLPMLLLSLGVGLLLGGAGGGGDSGGGTSGDESPPPPPSGW